MPDIQKINAVAIADIEKLDAVLAANIEKVNGLVFSTAPAIAAPAAAYSVRLLDTAVGVPTYTGAAMRVRRDTGTGGAEDDDEADIAFDTSLTDPAISLDSAISNASAGVTATTLGQFLNVGTVNGTTYTNPDSLTVTASCFVDEWKDQSGNANHTSQATQGSQPEIHDGTVNTDLITENGQPAVNFDGSNHVLRCTQTPSIGTGLAVFSVVNADTNTRCIYGQRTAGGLFRFLGNEFEMRDSTTVHSLSMTNPTQTQQIRSAAYRNSDGFVEAYIDGASDGTTTFTYGTEQAHTQIGLGAEGNQSNKFDGRIQEVVFYETDQINNQDGIHDNINSYFSIY